MYFIRSEWIVFNELSNTGDLYALKYASMRWKGKNRTLFFIPLQKRKEKQTNNDRAKDEKIKRNRKRMRDFSVSLCIIIGACAWACSFCCILRSICRRRASSQNSLRVHSLCANVFVPQKPYFSQHKSLEQRMRKREMWDAKRQSVQFRWVRWSSAVDGLMLNHVKKNIWNVLFACTRKM